MNSESILLQRFLQEHSLVAARKLEDIEADKLVDFFNDTPVEWLLDVVPLMNPQILSVVFEKLDQDVLVLFFESLELKFAVFLMRMLNDDLADGLLIRLSTEKAESVKRLLLYLDHTVGAHMDPVVFTLSENLTIKEALAVLTKHKRRIQPHLFVNSSDRKLVGVIALSDIITGDPDGEIKSIMNTKYTTLSPETPIQSVVSHHGWQSLYALPVVDYSSIFLGVISLESIRSVLASSGTEPEDMSRMTVNALGELYRLGLSGLVRSVTELRNSRGK